MMKPGKAATIAAAGVLAFAGLLTIRPVRQGVEDLLTSKTYVTPAVGLTDADRESWFDPALEQLREGNFNAAAAIVLRELNPGNTEKVGVLEDVVRCAVGDEAYSGLKDTQKLGLISLAAAGSYPGELLGPDICTAVNAGNTPAVVREIIKRSNRHDLPERERCNLGRAALVEGDRYFLVDRDVYIERVKGAINAANSRGNQIVVEVPAIPTQLTTGEILKDGFTRSPPDTREVRIVPEEGEELRVDLKHAPQNRHNGQRFVR